MFGYEAALFEAFLGNLVADDNRRFVRKDAQRGSPSTRSPWRGAFRSLRNAGCEGYAPNPIRICHSDRHCGIIVDERFVEVARLIARFADHGVVADRIDPELRADSNCVFQLAAIELHGARKVARLDKTYAVVITRRRNRTFHSARRAVQTARRLRVNIRRERQ